MQANSNNKRKWLIIVLYSYTKTRSSSHTFTQEKLNTRRNYRLWYNLKLLIFLTNNLELIDLPRVWINISILNTNMNIVIQQAHGMCIDFCMPQTLSYVLFWSNVYFLLKLRKTNIFQGCLSFLYERFFFFLAG